MNHHQQAPSTGRQATLDLPQLLAAGIVRPALEVVHGWRPRRQITRLCSPPLNLLISATLDSQRTRPPGVRGRPQLRWSPSGIGSGLSFSGTYQTVDGLVWPVSGELRRRPSTGRPFLVALETSFGRHTPIGPRPIVTRSRPRPPSPLRSR